MIYVTELEETILICAENAKDLATEVSALSAIGPFRLVARGAKLIRHLYLDTRQHALSSKRLALRKRELDGIRLITLKGPAQETREGAAERLEVEEPWTRGALLRVLDELRTRGVELPSHWKFEHGNVLTTMKGLELGVIQDRQTQRRIRNVLGEGGETERTLAELAIDSVEYRIRRRKINLHEIEIEAKAENASDVLEQVVENLIDRYKWALRKWTHSKLATGMAIEELLEGGRVRRAH